MKLKCVRRSDGVRDRVEAVYEIAHSNTKTTLTLDVVLVIENGRCSASIDVSGPVADTPDEAFAKLAEWLDRSADALHHREPTIAIPVGG